MMARMRLLPPRPWFQFRLTTWFVLVALLAWAMMLRPYYTNGRLFMVLVDPKIAAESRRQPFISNRIDVNNWGMSIREQTARQGKRPDFGFDNYDIRVWYWRSRLTLERLAYPALALAAFVGWKAASALWRSRARRQGEQA
jgi:hypothetical protein